MVWARLHHTQSIDLICQATLQNTRPGACRLEGLLGFDSNREKCESFRLVGAAFKDSFNPVAVEVDTEEERWIRDVVTETKKGGGPSCGRRGSDDNISGRMSIVIELG